jgi:predicted AlkP superfamily phosphohydrolase/phosphomutase
MSTKLLIIGIDALDSNQVVKFGGALPTLSWLKQECPSVTLDSVTPPDSDTAWASIYTGLNPAKHGVVQYVDPLEKTTRYISSDIDNHAIQKQTFWDIASRDGKRVCVLFPHLGYPPWPVNGIMVSRSAIKDDIEVYPPSIAKQHNLSKLNVVKGMPGRHKSTYIQANERLLSAQFEFALKMLEHEKWDLFFIYSSVLDMIQHYFWNLCDETDPSYPGNNPFHDTIKNFYILQDQLIEKLLSVIDSNTTVIILSDHGHGMRPVRVFSVNEFLRQQGLLVLKNNVVERDVSSFIDRTKGIALEIVSKYSIGTLASKLLSLMPWVRKLYTSPVAIDWEKTTAFATNLSSIKAYSYSGIVLQRERLSDSYYESVREALIQELSKVSDPISGKKLVKWIYKREDLYQGPHISKYPDIIFELYADFGVGLTSGNSLFEQSHSHHLVPGSHKGDSATFLLYNSKRPIHHTEMSLMDVVPTVLDIMDIECPGGLDGKSIFTRPVDSD